MKIDNIRLGFATNSSSSHSMIFDPSLIGKVNDNYNDNGFGWDFFTLVSKKAKKEYMAAMLRSTLLLDGMSEHMIRIIFKGMQLPYIYESYVDHESSYIFPNKAGTYTIDLEFVEDFQKYILREGMIIIGGNDNAEVEHTLYNRDTVCTFDNYKPDYRHWVSRKDGDWWTLYNRKSGTRAIFSFEENPSEFEPESPILLDYKITDYCGQNCEFCYMGSSKDGKHMKINFGQLNSIINNGIFEVALGGGEPTEHPRFYDIIKYLTDKGVVVNFSTKNLRWFDDVTMVTKVLDLVGAFAFSVRNDQEIDSIYKKMNVNKYDINKLTVQVIPDTLDRDTLFKIFKKCSEYRISVTLLGFKEVCRGENCKRTGIEKLWIDILKKVNNERMYPTVSIDTTLATRTEDKILKEGISSYLFHTHEGRYSAFIDGVENKFGPSSYEPDKLIPYTCNCLV